MSAHTITTMFRKDQRPRHLVALGLALCALAIPASAAAQPIDGDYSSVNAITAASEESTQVGQSPDYSTVNSIVPPESESGAAQQVDSGYSSLNAISHEPANGPTVVSGPAGEGEGFDWASALVGAGAALAMTAFGGFALLTLRRRTAVSQSA
jgi:hypothetical protein